MYGTCRKLLECCQLVVDIVGVVAMVAGTNDVAVCVVLIVIGCTRVYVSVTDYVVDVVV